MHLKSLSAKWLPFWLVLNVLITWIKFNLSMDWISNYIHHKVLNEITYPFPNFQPLKFGNGQIISSHTLLGMWLLSHTENEVNPCWKRGPWHKHFCRSKATDILFRLHQTTSRATRVTVFSISLVGEIVVIFKKKIAKLYKIYPIFAIYHT